MAQEREDGFKQLAEDAVGITAYKWVQQRKPWGDSDFFRRLASTVYVAGEIVFPTLGAMDRELHYDRNDITTSEVVGGTALDVSTNTLALIALATTYNRTSSICIAGGSFLISKFLLNTWSHSEYHRNKKQQ